MSSRKVKLRRNRRITIIFSLAVFSILFLVLASVINALGYVFGPLAVTSFGGIAVIAADEYRRA